MTKIGRPTRLIAYDTDMNMQRRAQGLPPVTKLIRPRTVLYAGLIAVVGGIMLYALATRGYESVSVIHDRNPLFVQLSNGAIRNAYTLRIVNKELQPRHFAVRVDGVPEAQIEIVGEAVRPTGDDPVIAVGPDQTEELRVLVSTRARLPANASLGVTFWIVDLESGRSTSAPDHFKGP